MQKELQAEVNAQEASGLLDDTYVAFLMGGENGELVGCSNRIRVS